MIEMKIKKFRKKPEIVEAVQIKDVKENFEEVKKWLRLDDIVAFYELLAEVSQFLGKGIERDDWFTIDEEGRMSIVHKDIMKEKYEELE